MKKYKIEYLNKVRLKHDLQPISKKATNAAKQPRADQKGVQRNANGDTTTGGRS